jgi:hypothetical protein
MRGSSGPTAWPMMASAEAWRRARMVGRMAEEEAEGVG